MNKNDFMTGEELGQKLLAAAQEMQAGKAARITKVQTKKAAKIEVQPWYSSSNAVTRKQNKRE